MRHTLILAGILLPAVKTGYEQTWRRFGVAVAAICFMMLPLALPVWGDELPSRAATSEFNQSVDELWPKIVQFLAIRSVNPTRLDKAAGVIAGAGISLGPNDLNCGAPRLLGDFAYNLSISLDRQGATRTSVTVLLNGSANLIRRRHFLWFRTSTVKTPESCFSTGSFETALFSYLK